MNDAQANVSSSNCKGLNYFHDKAVDLLEIQRIPKSACISLGTIFKRKVKMYNDTSFIS